MLLFIYITSIKPFPMHSSLIYFFYELFIWHSSVYYYNANKIIWFSNAINFQFLILKTIYGHFIIWIRYAPVALPRWFSLLLHSLWTEQSRQCNSRPSPTYPVSSPSKMPSSLTRSFLYPICSFLAGHPLDWSRISWTAFHINRQT